MNLAQISGGYGLNFVNMMHNGATMTWYQGTQPATPETALSGNTSTAVWTFSSPAFGTPSYASSKMTATASFTSATETPTANGTVTFARVTMPSTAWTASHAYTFGTVVTNSSNFYFCTGAGTSASSGGPTTTVQGITDGTVTWCYIGATSGQGNVVADYTIGTSGTDIIVGSTTLSTGVPVDITSFTLSIPVV